MAFPFKLGVAPKVIDFKNNVMHAIDMWFEKVTNRLDMVPPVAYYTQAVAQGIGSGLVTRQTFGTKIVDSTGITPNNFQFFPQVAGDYFISAATLYNLVAAPPAATFTIVTYIFKNGVYYASQNTAVPVGGTFVSATSTAVVSMNGTTDYIEIYTFQNSGVIRFTSATPDTYITMNLVRAL